MEIRKSANTTAESAEPTINIASTFENFPRTSIQQCSKDTNIINAINQLLSMYHPNDGVVAYEHVIKTLLVLSENLDSQTQQQIISIVPFPKGVSNEKIRNLMCKATELVNAANSISTIQKIAAVPKDKYNMDVLNKHSEIHLKQNVVIDTSQSFEMHEKFIPSVSEVFKGFPPNEISTIHNHVRNVSHTLSYTTPCIKSCANIKQHFLSNTNEQEETIKVQSNLKWFHTPHLLYKSNLCQSTACSYSQGLLKSMDDKYFQLSIDRVHNWNQCNVANISRTARQDTMYLNRKLYRSNIMRNQQNKSDVLNVEIASKPEMNYEISNNTNINKSLKNHHDNSNAIKNKNFNTEIQEYFGPEFKDEQEAIQRDIYKMDVVHCEDEKNNIITSAGVKKVLKEDDVVMNNFIIHEKLKTSLQNFLERAGRNIVIGLSILPQTEPLHEISSASRCWKLVNPKNLENNNRLNVSNDNRINYKITNTPENMKKYFEQKPSASSVHICPKSAQVQVLHKNLNTAVRKAQTVECEKRDNKENLLYKSAAKQTQKNCLDTLQQTTSITELATFKRHYYNTLLNIQKAKMAVTNSLAISSLENCFKCEPYHSNHSNQQQPFLQQRGSFINPQFAVHTMTQAELPNINNSLYSWVKCNNWKHPSMKQLRLTQQFPFHASKNKD